MAPKNKNITKANAKEMGAKGGRARAENFKKKKALKSLGRDTILELWNKPLKEGKVVDISEAKSMADIYGQNITEGQRIICELFKKAERGNIQAINLLFETAGFLDKEDTTISVEPVSIVCTWEDKKDGNRS